MLSLCVGPNNVYDRIWVSFEIAGIVPPDS